jgi:integrase
MLRRPWTLYIGREIHISIRRNGAGKWVIDFTRKGKRIIRVIGESKREAQDVLAAMKADILRERYGLRRALPDVLLETHAQEYLELYAKQNKRSWTRDETSINHLKEFFNGKNLSDITPELIEKYRLSRRADGVSPATINRETACLSFLYSKALAWGKAEVNPVLKVKKFREPASRERILTGDEARRLLNAASPELRPILITALGTGMRRGEILGLKWTDLDFVRGSISISHSKSGKPRKVPMSGTVAAALGAVPKRGEYVFHNPKTGRPIKDVKTAFHAACRRAKKNPKDKKDPGITGFRFHDLRHTALTWMLRGGADIITVSKIAGHARIEMSARYLHETGESMRLAVEKAGEFIDQSRKKVETIEIPSPLSDLKSFN